MPGHNDWLRKALSDLKMAKKGLLQDDDTLDGAAYHTHQCAEKALKGFLIFNKAAIVRTHDLEVLVEFCAVFDYDFNALMSVVETLNPYAIYSRYPDDRFIIDRSEVVVAVKKAEKVLKFVTKKIENPDPNLKVF